MFKSSKLSATYFWSDFCKLRAPRPLFQCFCTIRQVRKWGILLCTGLFFEKCERCDISSRPLADRQDECREIKTSCGGRSEERAM